ncbi:MAG TPA: tetratricopeptide repeat protein, partial [Blastocatellia bacterium]|nr:tetratricopeptide repeat protein [Blastocatellia bacterium]
MVGDFSLALDSWERAARRAPPNAFKKSIERVSRLLALANWHNGDVDRAIELWKTCLKQNPNDNQLLKNLAVASEKAGQTAAAITYWQDLAGRLRQAIKRQPSDQDLKDRLGSMTPHLIDQMLSEELPEDEITREMEAWVKSDPTNLEGRLKCAQLFLDFEIPRQALKHIEYVEKARGESVELLVLKAGALRMMDKDHLARKSTERAFDLNPSDPVAQHLYLSMLEDDALEAAEDGDVIGAIAICDRQLAVDPKYVPALALMAEIYFTIGRKTQAGELIQRVIESKPGAESHVMAGGIYLAGKDFKNAEAQFRRARALDSGSFCAFKIGETYLHVNKLRQALKYFDMAADGGSLKTLMEIASALFDADKDHAAQYFIKRAIRLVPSHPSPHILLAQRMITRGELADARKEVEEAERLALADDNFARYVSDVRMVMEVLREFEQMDELITSIK